jgi:2-keto-4-pentenoate hydratase
VSRALGWTQCGWKVGAASPTAQAIVKLYSPYAAPLFHERLFHSGDFVATNAANSRIVEPEVAFVMAAPLPPRAQPYTPAEALNAVASVHPALEVVNPRLTRALNEPAEWLVADGGTNDALVLGPACAPLPVGSYATIHARAKLNGAWVTSGAGVNVLGGPDRASRGLRMRCRATGASSTRATS